MTSKEDFVKTLNLIEKNMDNLKEYENKVKDFFNEKDFVFSFDYCLIKQIVEMLTKDLNDSLFLISRWVFDRKSKEDPVQFQIEDKHYKIFSAEELYDFLKKNKKRKKI